MTPKLFSELGLSAELLKAIDKLGFEQAAPIQAEAIPILMQGRDVVGQSQTGSGKTAAFAVPAIEKVDPDSRATQILILCPTRELAVQVSEEVHKLALFKRGVHALPIYGGQSYERQLFGLKQGAHIVIGTPGRVMDHMRRATLRLDSLKMVILDEVDVMLNMGFRDDIELILQSTPKERQTVVFSATIPRPIQELIKKYTRDPQSVRIEQKAMTVPTVEQVYYEVDRRYKIELLTRLIDIHDLKLGIIFCNTKRMVDDLVDHLNAQGYSADRLHGDMNQTQRDRVMNKFRKSGLEFLVATDVAARGIDVDDIEVVFNYDLPYDGEDYVHRIGRTGRAGKPGRSFTLAAPEDGKSVAAIAKLIGRDIPPVTIPGIEQAELEFEEGDKRRGGRGRSARPSSATSERSRRAAPRSEERRPEDRRPERRPHRTERPVAPEPQRAVVEPDSAVAVRPAMQPRPRPAAQPRPAAKPVRREPQEERRVVGFGDHLPAFLR